MRKNFEVSTDETAPAVKRSSDAPVNQVGNRVAFDLLSSSAPAVR